MCDSARTVSRCRVLIESSRHKPSKAAQCRRMIDNWVAPTPIRAAASQGGASQRIGNRKEAPSGPRFLKHPSHALYAPLRLARGQGPAQGLRLWECTRNIAGALGKNSPLSFNVVGDSSHPKVMWLCRLSLFQGGQPSLWVCPLREPM